MPAGSGDQFVPLPPPAAGLNLDTSATQIDPLESPELYNELIHEPGQMRRRRGWRRKINLSTWLTAGRVPFQAMLWNSRMMVGILGSQDAFIPPYRTVSPTSAVPAGYSRTNGSVFPLVINADDDQSWSAAMLELDGTNGPFAEMMPLTAPSPYEASTYGTSIKAFSAKVKDLSTRTATRLTKWAGANVPTVAVTASINNDAVSGTFSSGPVNSLKDCYLRFDSESPGYSYSYQIKTHTAGATSFTLYKPYGLGENLTNVPNKSAQAAKVRCMDWVENCPPDVQCSIVHYERLFVGRPTLIADVGDLARGEYPNAICWSDPGEPEKWNDTRVIQVDDRPDDAIMGFGHAGQDLLIFKYGRVYRMSGYNEQTFTVKLVTAEYGCVDSRSIVQYKDGCGFMSASGYRYIDSGDAVEWSQMRPGHGIRRDLLPEVAKDDSTFNRQMHLQSTAALIDAYLVLSNQDNRSTAAMEDNWMFYCKNKSWARWGNSEAGLQPYCYTPANQYLNGRVCGLFQNFIAEIDHMFGPEEPTTALVDTFDEYYEAGTPATTYIPFVLRFKDFRVYGGDTGRFRAAFVEHCIQYVGASDATQNGVEVTVNRDENISVLPTDVDTIDPNFVSGATVPDPERIYVKEMRENYFQMEAMAFRIRLSMEFRDTGTFPHVAKFFLLRMLMEETKSGRIQNAVLV
jgi:hypothetical protein